MVRLLYLTCALAVLVPASLHAQVREDRRSPEQIADSMTIARTTRSIVKGAHSDSARAALLYEWVARNLVYDVDGFLRGRLSDGKPEDVFRKRKAVCGGFVALYQRMAQEAGLEAVPILGYAKGFTYRPGVSTGKPNHSWLAVRIDGRWRLVDPTWAAGFVNGRTFQPAFTWDYFLVDPNTLILSHFPEESEWQLLPQTVSRKDFERLPLVPRTVVKAGFDPILVRTIALRQKIRTFPHVAAREDFRIIQAPLSGVLPKASKLAIDIAWPRGSEVALVIDGAWRKLERAGDRFRGEAIVGESEVFLVGRTGPSQQFETLLQYQVR